MRVAYITNAPFISGAERSLQTILRNLADSPIEPLVICPPDSPFGPWCREHEIRCVTTPVAIRDKWHPLCWLSSVRRIRGLLKHWRIELVHSNQIWSYPAVARAAAHLKIPRICHLRDEVGNGTLEWWLRDGVEKVICISQHIENQFLRICPSQLRDRSRVLLNPVMLPLSRSVQERQNLQLRARQRLKIDTRQFAIGFIGQIVPVKNLPLLIEALATMRDDHRWQAIVAGHDPRPGAEFERQCRQRVAQLGLAQRVRFFGFVDDLSSFYEALDVVVVPSREEPLGRVPLEAAAFYKPAVATRIGGLPETVLDQQTGFLIPPDDAAALKEVLQGLIERCNFMELGTAAREFAEKVSAPRHYVNDLHEMYIQLIQQRMPV
jgi:glycosyltransferase involved in cell wall biosynthesis